MYLLKDKEGKVGLDVLTEGPHGMMEMWVLEDELMGVKEVIECGENAGGVVSHGKYSPG